MTTADHSSSYSLPNPRVVVCRVSEPTEVVVSLRWRRTRSCPWGTTTTTRRSANAA
jgi:hypothetical protein